MTAEQLPALAETRRSRTRSYCQQPKVSRYGCAASDTGGCFHAPLAAITTQPRSASTPKREARYQAWRKGPGMASEREGQVWLMLAFPGDETGQYALRAYAPSKSGKSWYRIFRTRDAAIGSKRELIEAGIGYKCTKVDAKPRRQQA
jgi:hypothetical protein